MKGGGVVFNLIIKKPRIIIPDNNRCIDLCASDPAADTLVESTIFLAVQEGRNLNIYRAGKQEFEHL